MWDDAVAVGKTADPRDPRLDDHASGKALALLQYTIKHLDDRKLVAKGSLSVEPFTVSTAEKKVLLRDCLDATHWLNYHKDGSLENDRPGGRYRADATVSRSGEEWTVTKLYLHSRGSC